MLSPKNLKKIIYAALTDMLTSEKALIGMKIQEMKSGILHLTKKMEENRRENYLTTLPANDAFASPVAEPRPNVEAISDLDRPMWSVVSFDRCEAYGLPYRQAADLMSQFDARGVNGLCIITDEAARRIRR